MKKRTALAIASLAIACGSKKEVSTNGGSAVVPPPTRDASVASTTKWVIQSSGGNLSRLALTRDGDVIAAGELEKQLVLGDKSAKAEGHGVWVARVSPAGRCVGCAM